MKITKSHIRKQIELIRKPNNLKGQIGRYKVAIKTEDGIAIFETDQGGNLFYQKAAEKKPASWTDTGSYCDTKEDFINQVHGWLN